MIWSHPKCEGDDTYQYPPARLPPTRLNRECINLKRLKGESVNPEKAQGGVQILKGEGGGGSRGSAK
jgi:hypothetical protein